MIRFLALPEFDDDDLNIKARLIYWISAGMILLAFMFILIVPFFVPALLKRSIFLAAFAIPVCIGSMLLIRSSRLRLASMLLIAMVWLAVTVGSLTAGGVSAPIFMGYVIVIILGGLLFENRTSFFITLISILSALFIAFAEMEGQLPEGQGYSSFDRVSISIFFFILVTLLQNFTAGTIRRLFTSAKESETKYKLLLESIPTITYIQGPDLDATTQYVSPQVEKLVAYSREEFLNDPIMWKKILHPDDRERVLKENERTVQSGEPFEMEYRMLTKDQRIVWVRDEAILVRNAEGQPQYWVGVWTDISTRKQVEAQQADLIGVMTQRTIQLQTAAEVSRAASSILDTRKLLPTVVELIRNHFDYYYVGIFLMDDSKQWALLGAATGEMGKQMLVTGHRLEVADSSMIGWCISHGQARIALDVGEDAVRFKNPYLPLTRSEMALPLITHGEVIGAMTIQSELPSAFSRVDITALQTMADQIANAIDNARLFTERASLISELEKRNAELEQFTYTVSHDLRSPLVTIRGFLGYLQQDAVSGDLTRFDKDMNRIANAVDKMQVLLNDLLELSRIGRVINPAEHTPFGQIVKETIDLLTGSLDERKVKVDVQDHFPTVHGDHTRLVEVMQNLISNAIKFMGDQPEPLIEIGTAGLDEKDNKPIFFVRDNGIGIDPQYHKRIFGLFNRLDPTTEGTGIGLTLVRRIIEVHGGRIWVESQLGSGATFLFTLPT